MKLSVYFAERETIRRKRRENYRNMINLKC